ncbi:MAG: hypothetical protein GY842_09250 [bacterium]|nr:hypothetical protein [bacterium]
MSANTLPQARRFARHAVLLIAFVAAGSGCAPQWYLSYAEVEQARVRDRQRGRPEQDILVFYKDHLDAKSGQMQDVLDSPKVKPLLADKYRCILVTDFSLNQRYVAQYGVDAAPALVVIHPDGTFHARTELLSAEQTRGFLTQAKGPGASPATDLQILPVPSYDWKNIYEEAVDLARRQNRPLLVLYKSWLSAESTELLNRLSRPRVQRLFGEMVHCILDSDYRPNRPHVARYGIDPDRVPALVVVRPDGTYHRLVGLPSLEQLVRFAVGSRSPGQVASGGGRKGVDAELVWQYSYDRARIAAQRQDRPLFIFYHSVFTEASNRSARLFEAPEAAVLLGDAVPCHLDWAIVRNREVAARFALEEPPGYVVLRPDGTYHARSGPITVEELADLLHAAEKPGAHPTDHAK